MTWTWSTSSVPRPVYFLLRMQSSDYLSSTPKDGVFRFKSRARLHTFLGIHDRFNECIAYAPCAKLAPNCSNPIAVYNRLRRPQLLDDLMTAKIPSRQAEELLEALSHCVVCRITGLHQEQSPGLFQKWRQQLWRMYLEANGLDPGLRTSQPRLMTRRSWLSGVEIARIEYEAQIALLAASSEADSVSGSEEVTDVSSDDASSDDDPTDNGQEEPDIATPDTSISSLEYGDDLICDPAPIRVEHSVTGEGQTSLSPTIPNADIVSRPSPRRNNRINHTSRQGGGSAESTEQHSTLVQRSSQVGRLQVYRDPPPPPLPDTPSRPGLASNAILPASSPTECPPSHSRRALGTVDRNIDARSQNEDQEFQSRSGCPKKGYNRRNAGSYARGMSHATQNSVYGQRAQPLRNETARDCNYDLGRTVESIPGTNGHLNNHACVRAKNTERSSESLEERDGDVMVAAMNNSGYTSHGVPSACGNALVQMLGQFNITYEHDFCPPGPSSSPLSRGYRIYPQLGGKENLKSILHTILQYSGPRNRSDGYIYAFSRPTLTNFLKIGFTKAMNIPTRPYPDPVENRLARWASDCGHPVAEVFREYMPCAAERMESLIHQTLREYRRVQSPACNSCRFRRGGRGGAHDEWFEIDVEKAMKTVRSWALFSRQKPYDSFGKLVDFWAQKAEKERQLVQDGLHIGVWLEKMPQYIEEMTRFELRSIVASPSGLML